MGTTDAAQELHKIEHNMEHFETQRKNFQMQLSEVESALLEIGENEHTYKIVANIMIKRDSKKTIEELKEKKETLQIRINSIEKQEKKLEEKVKELQEIVLENNKK